MSQSINRSYDQGDDTQLDIYRYITNNKENRSSGKQNQSSILYNQKLHIRDQMTNGCSSWELGVYELINVPLNSFNKLHCTLRRVPMQAPIPVSPKMVDSSTPACQHSGISKISSRVSTIDAQGCSRKVMRQTNPQPMTQRIPHKTV
ncbi:hypothetical protein Dimus_038789 [Dionaea muscipula]